MPWKNKKRKQGIGASIVCYILLGWLAFFFLTAKLWIIFSAIVIVIISTVVIHICLSKKPIETVQDRSATLGPPREPLPVYLRRQVYNRALRQCENPFCQSKGRLEVHHIDMNHQNNRLFNLVALCPICHEGAHSGKYPPTQVHNWMNMDYKRLLQRQPALDASMVGNQNHN
jgi:hypothetical protein